MAKKVRVKINVNVPNSEISIHNFKNSTQRELINKNLKRIKSYETPSEKRTRKKEEAARRLYKSIRKSHQEEE